MFDFLSCRAQCRRNVPMASGKDIQLVSSDNAMTRQASPQVSADVPDGSLFIAPTVPHLVKRKWTTAGMPLALPRTMDV